MVKNGSVYSCGFDPIKNEIWGVKNEIWGVKNEIWGVKNEIWGVSTRNK
jgi:hypothetical protein